MTQEERPFTNQNMVDFLEAAVMAEPDAPYNTAGVVASYEAAETLKHAYLVGDEDLIARAIARSRAIPADN